jgi:hypothetical protein
MPTLQCMNFVTHTRFHACFLIKSTSGGFFLKLSPSHFKKNMNGSPVSEARLVKEHLIAKVIFFLFKFSRLCHLVRACIYLTYPRKY